MYGTQPNRIHPHSELIPILEHLCSTSNNLTNCGIYLARQQYFQQKSIIGKYDLEKALKGNANFKALYSQCSQQILRSVAEAFQSFQKLKKAFFDEKLNSFPKLPNYRTKGGMNVASYPKQALKLKGNQVRVPLGKSVKVWFGLKEFLLPLPANLQFDQIKELRILPRNREFYAEWVYEKTDNKTQISSQAALGIDPGIDNWLTCVSTVGESFIIDGKKVKSLNQNYNRRIASLKEGKPQGYWDDQLARITEKRNRQMRDGVNQAAKKLINYCLQRNIGIIVFGWNVGQRQNVNLGHQTNQNFVGIPTGKLKNRIQQLALIYGIKFLETEESYTSVASFLDNDSLPKFGEKPERWQPSGKRVHRGLYQDSQGRLINADCNAAANILKKVEIQLGLDLAKVCRAALTLPSRLYIWNSKRRNEATRFLTRCGISWIESSCL